MAETCQTSQPTCSDIREETANERPRENCKPQMLNWNPLRTKTMIKRFSKVDFYKIGDPLYANPLSPFLHCDLRLRWKVASDLRFRAAISEPKTPSFCGISGDLAPSTRKLLAIAIVRFWCGKELMQHAVPKTIGTKRRLVAGTSGIMIGRPR